jgi:hypothetical protein
MPTDLRLGRPCSPSMVKGSCEPFLASGAATPSRDLWLLGREKPSVRWMDGRAEGAKWRDVEIRYFRFHMLQV